jgi:APA family basic amino acid/polyamine antiporter
VLWTIGGVLAICGALAQAELISRIPASGGDYVILTKAYGPFSGFLSGWLSLVLGFAGPIAASSKAAARYLLSSFQTAGAGVSETAIAVIATSVILALTWLHSHNYERSSLTQNFSTIVKLFFLTTFIVLGISIGLRSNDVPQDWPAKIDLPLASVSLTSLIYISYAYTGWNAIGFIAGDMREPQRNLPLSILLGTGIVLAIYLGANFVYSLAWSAEELRELADRQGFDALAPIAELSARRLFGDGTARVLSLIVFLMLIASVSAYLLTGSRIIQAMALSGQFPRWAQRSNAHGVPARATYLQTVVALVFVWVSSLESIIVVSSIGLAIFSMITISSIFRMRARDIGVEPRFRCPLFPLVPLVYLLGTGLLTFETIRNKPRDGLVSLGCVAVGAVAFFVHRLVRGTDHAEDVSPDGT